MAAFLSVALLGAIELVSRATWNRRPAHLLPPHLPHLPLPTPLAPAHPLPPRPHLAQTPDNFDKEVFESGKAAFVKFLAPW